MEKKKLRLEYLKMVIYTLGMLSYSIFGLLIKTQQRYLFIIVGIYFLISLINEIYYLGKIKSENRILKYSRKTLNGKSLKKLSY